MIGLDVHGYDTGSEVITIVGDPNALVDFARGFDMAAVTNAAAVPIVLQQAQDSVSAEVAKSGATLEGQLEITPQNGRFRVAGTASKSTGSATFSFGLVPELFASRPGGAINYIEKPFVIHPRSWAALSFSTADVHVNVDPSPWVVVLAALGTALNLAIPLIVIDMIRSTAAHLETSIAGQDPSAPVARVQRFPPAKAEGATVRIELAAYEITTDGVYTGLTMGSSRPRRRSWGRPRSPPTCTPARCAIGSGCRRPARRRSAPAHPLDSHRPRGGDGAPQRGCRRGRPRDLRLRARDRRAGPDATGGRLPRLPPALGPDTTDFVNEGIRLEIRGALPAGAYVRWRYEVKNPQVVFDDPTRTWAYRGDEIVKRHSNLHSTEFPCANARRISRYAGDVERLDALPFAVGDVSCTARSCATTASTAARRGSSRRSDRVVSAHRRPRAPPAGRRGSRPPGRPTRAWPARSPAARSAPAVGVDEHEHGELAREGADRDVAVPAGKRPGRLRRPLELRRQTLVGADVRAADDEDAAAPGRVGDGRGIASPRVEWPGPVPTLSSRARPRWPSVMSSGLSGPALN